MSSLGKGKARSSQAGIRAADGRSPIRVSGTNRIIWYIFSYFTYNNIISYLTYIYIFYDIYPTGSQSGPTHGAEPDRKFGPPEKWWTAVRSKMSNPSRDLPRMRKSDTCIVMTCGGPGAECSAFGIWFISAALNTCRKMKMIYRKPTT